MKIIQNLFWNVSRIASSAVCNSPNLICPQDEAILKLENEISRLVGLESESKHKDTVIANLQDEIAVMTKKMAQEAARNDVEFTQKLLSFEQDIGAKTEEIKALKEQVLNTSRDVCLF